MNDMMWNWIECLVKSAGKNLEALEMLHVYQGREYSTLLRKVCLMDM